MSDTPDTAERLAEIQDMFDMHRGLDTIDISDLLNIVDEHRDHIDTLTAKLAEVEAEREALRAALSAYHAGRIGQSYFSPSPVEGGQ
jgi:hypothetical protein